MTCSHSQEGVYIACVHCDIEHATLVERERIIKLLEEQVEKWDLITEGELKSVSHYWVGLVSTSFIALIKGEK
jgi:hypothetical protein